MRPGRQLPRKHGVPCAPAGGGVDRVRRDNYVSLGASNANEPRVITSGLFVIIKRPTPSRRRRRHR